MKRRKQLLNDKSVQQDRIQASILRAEKRSRINPAEQNSGEADDS